MYRITEIIFNFQRCDKGGIYTKKGVPFLLNEDTKQLIENSREMEDICNEATALIINRVDKMNLKNHQKVATVLIITGAMNRKFE